MFKLTLIFSVFVTTNVFALDALECGGLNLSAEQAMQIKANAKAVEEASKP